MAAFYSSSMLSDGWAHKMTKSGRKRKAAYYENDKKKKKPSKRKNGSHQNIYNKYEDYSYSHPNELKSNDEVQRGGRGPHGRGRGRRGGRRGPVRHETHHMHHESQEIRRLTAELQESKKRETMQKQANFCQDKEIDELTQKLQDAQQENVRLNNELEQMRNANKLNAKKRISLQQHYEQQIRELQSQNNKLLDDQKEHEVIINELRAEISEMKLNAVDISNYQSWKYEEILMWIMSLDNHRFDKYHDRLSQSLKEEGIEGMHLNEVNEIDIKGWGIKNFQDKKFLLKQIKELVQKNMNNDGFNEGVPTAYIG